ncbi:MAG: endonuclease MutS2 [Dehalococcoidia bacterium]|nr:endonuclease MutS2 [Dehalococcoidia bacterium]
MDAHTLRVLEFEKVLTLLAAETAFSLGRELALELRPATTFTEALQHQTLTAEARLLDQQGIDLSFAGARDIRATIHAAAIGQALDPSDLVEAASTLKAAWRARQTLERVRSRVAALAAVTDGVSDFRRFTDAVDEAITARGEVADAASETLAATRRERRIAQERLDQRAQAALADAIRRGIAQEALLTERNGRKVIPIKSDHRGQIAGIVHDVSSSGATVFLEPVGVVETGNQVRELQLAEEREVRRVLQRLTAILGDREQEAQESLLALARLDVLHAKVRLARRWKAALPPPGDAASWLAAGGASVLVRARHPLLRGAVVPIDVEVGGAFQGVVVTGPNTGGKTVALKTLGLLTLMAQAGLPLPCEERSRLVVYERVYADIGDEQSIEQSLSTFSSHMRNITGILERAVPGTLVLLDELGAGTDPTEGAALARAILETLLERGCTIVATTHHGELKALAHSDPRLRNASVEFDVETLSPTYHLTIGLPGQSNAIAIARRLGLDEGVLTLAQGQLAPEHFELEQLLGEIRQERSAAAEARGREEAARREAEDLRLALAERRDRVEQERAAILQAAHDEAEDELAAVRRELEQLRRRAAHQTFDRQAAEDTLRQLDANLSRLAARARPQRRQPQPTPATREIGPGDNVHVRDIPQSGEALSAIGEDGRVEVQFGGLRMKVSVDRIDRVESSPRSQSGGPVVVPASRATTPIEIDLRGKRADEALEECEVYLDDAFRAGLPFVRIIHGKGTGALRAAIRQALAGHPLVRRYESAGPREGGEGVTVVVLAG